MPKNNKGCNQTMFSIAKAKIKMPRFSRGTFFCLGLLGLVKILSQRRPEFGLEILLQFAHDLVNLLIGQGL